MDQLEKFISDNRNALDKYEPSPQVWEKIMAGSRPKKRSFRIILTRVAVIALIASTTFFAWLYIRSNSPSGSIQQGSDELREAEIYYNTLAGRLLEEALPMLATYPGLEEDLLKDISHLDSICMEIRKDLKDNVSNQEVIEALILNYKVKVEILKEMIDVLNESAVNENGKKADSYEL